MNQCDKLCRYCEFYEIDIFQDSFGQAVFIYCLKGRNEYVKYDAEACTDFISKQNERRT